MSRFTQVRSLGPRLDRQIDDLKRHFPASPEIAGVLLIGSCSLGAATYRSDVDLLVILREGPLDFGRVRSIRDWVTWSFESRGLGALLGEPLPVQLTVVLPSVFTTSEPAMSEALKSAIVLYDPTGEIARRVA